VETDVSDEHMSPHRAPTRHFKPRVLNHIFPSKWLSG